MIAPYKNYLSFLLSFLLISSYWKTHHDLFHLINHLDEKQLYINLGWLFFNITIPFSTSLLADNFGTTLAMIVYSSNIFLLSILQKMLWYKIERKIEINEQKKLDNVCLDKYNFMLNTDIFNALIGVAFSFYYPLLAFYSLFFKLPIVLYSIFYVSYKKKRIIINN